MENIDINWKTTTEKSSPYTSSMNIFVSGLLHREDGMAVCVMVEDEGKSAEFRLNPQLPGEVLMNNGYTFILFCILFTNY